MRPAGLEVAVVKEKMTEANGNLISRNRRPVLQKRRDKIRKGKVLGKEIRDTHPAAARITVPRVKGILKHGQKSEGGRIPAITAAYTRSNH